MTAKLLPLFAAGLLFASCGGSEPSAPEAKVGDAIEQAEPATTVRQTNTYQVVPTESQVLWTGGKIVGDTHTGTLSISQGRLALAGDELVGGEFTIDMNSLTNTDLDENSGKGKLEGHLKSGDFFDTENYPEAKFTLVQIQPVTDQADVTHELTGNLELHGATKSVTIPANVMVTPEAVTAVTPAFEINRTDWGVKYGSGIIGTVQDKAIKDEVKLVINLKANRA